MKVIIAALLSLSLSAFAQSPPQIPLTGNIGIMGSAAILGGTAVQMSSDADYTLTPAQWSNKTLIVTSAVSLTATRKIIAPLNKGQEFNVENSTSGAQSITVIGASGTGVTIANGTSAAVFSDGTNYIQISGGITSLTGNTVPPITNQVVHAASPTAIRWGGFLTQLDFTNCSVLYLLNEGSGTVATNLCATGSSRNGTIIGSPTWTTYGIALNPNGATGQGVNLPATENTAHSFLIAGYFPYFGTWLGVNWGTNSTVFPHNGITLCGTDGSLMCTTAWNQNGFGSNVGNYLQMYRPAISGTTQSLESVPTGWHVIGITCSTTAANNQLYVDGRPLPLATVGISCPTTTNLGNYQIGWSSLFVGGKAMMLRAAETFQTGLTDTQMQAQSQALLDYAGATGNVIEPKRYYVNQGYPWLGCIGDSRTAGVTGPSPCTYITPDDATTIIEVLANSGASAADYCAAISPSVIQGMPKVAGKSVAIVWIDVNDINGADTVSNILSQDKCIAQNFKNVGPDVYIATEISSSQVANGDADKNAIDPVIRQQAKQWGFAGVVDLADLPILGANGASANLSCFTTGGLHPLPVCNQYIGAVYSNILNEANGSAPLSYNTTAATPYQELPKDGYLRLTGTAAQTITLPDCQGYSKPRTIYNISGFSATVNPAASGFGSTFTETIDGNSSATIPTGHTAVYGIIPGPMATGGCSWQTLQ